MFSEWGWMLIRNERVCFYGAEIGVDIHTSICIDIKPNNPRSLAPSLINIRFSTVAWERQCVDVTQKAARFIAQYFNVERKKLLFALKCWYFFWIMETLWIYFKHHEYWIIFKTWLTYVKHSKFDVQNENRFTFPAANSAFCFHHS